MAGICSAHTHKEPGCRLCAMHPRDLFPDWDEKVKDAERAGLHACRNCKFEFYRTTEMCPKCGTTAKMLTLMHVKDVNKIIANDLLWFVGEWAKTTGYSEPRIKPNKDGSIEIRVFDK